MSWKDYYKLREKHKNVAKLAKCVQCGKKFEVTSTTNARNYICWKCRGPRRILYRGQVKGDDQRGPHNGSPARPSSDIDSFAYTKGL